MLAACGGGGGGGGGGTPGAGAKVSLSGKIIDGYLQGATVCLDLNSNAQCDSNEPSATSGSDGSYKLPETTDARARSAMLLVKTTP